MKLNRLFIKNYMSMRSWIVNFSDGITALTGQNGSGKSTIADCLGVVLFDQQKLGVTSKKPRTLYEGIRWNVAGQDTRTGAVTSYFIIELLDSDGTRILQGVRMDTSGNNAPVKHFFSCKNIPLEMLGCQGDNKMGEDDDILYAGNPVVRIYTSKKEAFDDFFRQRKYNLGFINDDKPATQYQDLMLSLVKNTGIDGGSTMYQDFVKHSIFPKPVAAACARERYETIKEYKQTKEDFDNYEEQKTFYTMFCERYETYKDIKDRYDLLHDNMPYILIASAEKAIKQGNENIVRRKTAIEEYNIKIGNSKERRKKLSDMLVDLKLENKNEFDLQNRLHELDENLAVLKKYRNDYAVYCKTLNDLLYILDVSSKDGETDWSYYKPFFDDYCSRIRNEIESCHIKNAEIKRSVADLRTRINELTGNIRNGNGIAASAAALRDRINEEFEAAGINEKAAILYECIDEVKDPEWQKAVEALMGNNRFGIIVSPDHYKDACRIQHDFQSDLRKGTLILKTRRKENIHPVAKSVYNILSINDDRADDYLYNSYSDCLLADTNEEYTSVRNALRKNGQHQNGNGSYYRPGEIDDIQLFIGLRVRKMEAEKCQAILSSEQEKLRANEQKERELGVNLHKAEDIMTSIMSSPVQSPDAFSSLSDVEQQYKTVKQELAAAENGEQHRLYIEKKKELEDEQDKIQTEIDELGTYLKTVKDQLNTDTGNLSRAEELKKKYENEIEESVENLSPETEEFIQNNIVNIIQNPETVLMDKLSQAEKAMTNEKQGLEKAWAAMPKSLQESVAGLRYERPDNPRNYANIKSQLQGMTLDIDRQKQSKMETLIKNMEEQFTDLLYTMGEDYENAVSMRSRYNSFISKYPIGDITYWISEIREQNSNDNIQILRAACDMKNAVVGDNVNAARDFLKGCAEKMSENNFEALFDYTNYITCHVMFRKSNESKSMDLDTHPTQGSNGQQKTLAYFLYLGAVACQVYNDDSLRVVLCDEAAQGIDSINIASFANMVKDTNVQVITFSQQEIFNAYAGKVYYISTPSNGAQHDIMHITEGVRKAV